jgi:transcriptional regulator with XRE-family HTH domain
MNSTDWALRAELSDLLRACRARMARPAVPGSRHGGLRQEDVANLAGISLRRYAALERGEFTPPAAMVDQVAVALQMSGAERSALHVLATGQDPPRPLTRPAQEKPREPGKAVRELISHVDPYPAAVTDEKWTVLFHNRAMDDWAGGWYSAADPSDRNLVMHLFSSSAEDFRPDVHALRRAGIAMLRYRYTRDLASPGFSRLIARLVESSREAAELWARHEVVFPLHEYPVRVRRPETGTVDAHVLHTPVTPRLWTYTMVLPSGPGSAP